MKQFEFKRDPVEALTSMLYSVYSGRFAKAGGRIPLHFPEGVVFLEVILDRTHSSNADFLCKLWTEGDLGGYGGFVTDRDLVRGQCREFAEWYLTGKTE